MLTKDDVGKIADKYLMFNVGNLVGPGEPKFDEGKKIWTVPVFHSSKKFYFEMGEMTINTEGNVITVKLLEDSPEIREVEKDFYESLKLSEKQ